MGKTAPGTLTTLGIAVLALLVERSMHPYEMYLMLMERREDRLVKVRPGSLYHTVARLADQEFVRPTGTDRAGNRPERTVYEITPEGREALRLRVRELLRTVQEYLNFPVALAEAHNLPREQVIELLRHRVAELRLRIAEYGGMRDWAVERRVARCYWVELDYALAMLGAEANWLEKMVDDLVSGELPWPADDPETGVHCEPPHHHNPWEPAEADPTQATRNDSHVH